jgi:transcriptional regulator with XRE-family HTH domain
MMRMAMTVQEYRVSLGWSITELARRAGVSPRTVSRLEDGLPVYDYIAGAVAKALSEGLGKTITVNDLEGVKFRK